ncbi:hypothetical protein NDU88_001462 [Pleurodeles waltl]|uniref:Uncharacterized protein n=1 Tax=Pleurodeles waltl TaxID=8319 RepID=A0AAV7WLK5_PLEWA|nr:hypothetical protein NDU88_001462 [Pleurodeles waltl]
MALTGNQVAGVHRRAASVVTHRLVRLNYVGWCKATPTEQHSVKRCTEMWDSSFDALRSTPAMKPQWNCNFLTPTRLRWALSDSPAPFPVFLAGGEDREPYRELRGIHRIAKEIRDSSGTMRTAAFIKRTSTARHERRRAATALLERR